MKKIIISIDGPAGSGKERIAKYIAKKWGLNHLDSGILYRRLAYNLLKAKINITNKSNILSYISKIHRFSLRNSNVLRTEKVSNLASKIAVLKFVRMYINNLQRSIVYKNIHKKGYVIDGRDIGSVVFNDANLKLYIEVDEKIRAKRRYKQLIDMGEKSIYPKILEEIRLRDNKDKNRKHSPLIIPKGAVIIDNNKSFSLATKKIDTIIKRII